MFHRKDATVDKIAAPITEALSTTGGPVVKTFASGAEVRLAARVRTPVGAKVGAALTILQTTHFPASLIFENRMNP